MASSVGERINSRLAALWDSTPNATIAGAVFTAGIVVFLAVAFVSRPSEPNVGSAQSSTAQPFAVPDPTPTEEAPPVTEADPFFVVGGQIVDPDGNLFVPVGVNGAIKTTDYPYVYEGGNGGINGRLESIGIWRWNTVRATLRCADESGVPTQQEVIDGIDETVQELTQARIVVILACHDGTGSDLVLDSALDLQVRAFWDEVVPRYQDNPYVWFNFFNEPQTKFDPEVWLELHRFYYDRYRSTGAENIMVFDLPNFGQGIDLLAGDTFADELGGACNTVFGWHAWGSLSGVQASDEDYAALAATALRRNLAVTITEAGVPEPLDAGTAGNPEWNTSGYYAALKVAESSPIGLLWWHGTGDTSEELFYPLKADRSGFWTASSSGALTSAGASFWEYSHRERTVEQFNGDLTDSGCPSSFDIALNDKINSEVDETTVDAQG